MWSEAWRAWVTRREGMETWGWGSAEIRRTAIAVSRKPIVRVNPRDTVLW